MSSIEEAEWGLLVRGHLAPAAAGGLAKKQQQALAAALQEWTAHCIQHYLKNIDTREKRKWEIGHRGRDFLGLYRSQEVDVWMNERGKGLALAVDPKHFQSRKSYRKNWKNGLNDLVAFATNLHGRFPLCAVGGVIAFPAAAATEADLTAMHNVCVSTTGRIRPGDPAGMFEALGLAIYDDAANLSWPFEEGSPLKPSYAFSKLAETVFSRTVRLL